jgi:flagellar biosynthesis component FlhA
MKTEEPEREEKKPKSAGKREIIVVMAAVACLIIIPFPIIVLDVLMAVNIILAVGMFLFAIFSQKRRRDLSGKVDDLRRFPMALLICTLFGVMVNIDSGRPIFTKGAEFDSLIIGFIAGLISRGGIAGIIVAFICFIAACLFMAFGMKSSSRFYEIAARFDLDVMPVKMRAVEAAYNRGEISEEIRSAQKTSLQEQADFLGAMDGALKFITGALKITICITAVVVLGSVITGITFRGQTIQEAAVTSMSLAVAHGLIFLLPLLLLSVAGIATSRTIKDKAGSWKTKDEDNFDPANPLRLELGYKLIHVVDKASGEPLLNHIVQVRKEFKDLGIVIPKIRIIDNMRLKPNEYRIIVYGGELGRGEIQENYTILELSLIISDHLREIIKKYKMRFEEIN